MSRTIQFRRLGAATLANTTGANGELIINNTNKTLTVHDGFTPGGFALLNSVTGNNIDQPARNTANSASSNTITLQAEAALANAQITAGRGVNATQNSRITTTEIVNNTQNAQIIFAINLAQAAYDYANTVSVSAIDQYARNEANAAVIASTSALNENIIIRGVDITQNARISVIEGVNVTQNARISVIEGVNVTQNTNITNATNLAQSAYNNSNTKLSLSGGTVTGNLTSLGVIGANGNIKLSNTTYYSTNYPENFIDPFIPNALPNGADVTLNAGDPLNPYGKITATPNQTIGLYGGNLNLNAGNSYEYGGNLELNAGDAVADPSFGFVQGLGGRIHMTAGDGGMTYGGGEVQIKSGDNYSYPDSFSDGSGGNLKLYAGGANEGGSGGDVLIFAGTATGSNSALVGPSDYEFHMIRGGSVTISGGRGPWRGGDLNLYGGKANRTAATGGDIHLEAGEAEVPNTIAGQIHIVGGSGQGSNTVAGNVYISGGHTVFDGGGHVYIHGGDVGLAFASGVSGVGGNVSIRGGYSDALNVGGIVSISSNNYVSISTNTSHVWTFGTNGTTTFPTGGQIANYPGGVGANNNSWFLTPSNGIGGISSQDGQQYIQINNNLFIEIGTGYGTANAFAWQFGLDGSLRFPEGNVQTGAAISITELKALVANCATYGDFQTAIAAL